MRSKLGMIFPDAGAAARAMEAHVQGFRVRTTREGGRRFLHLPGRPPLPWREHARRIALSRHAPVSDAYESGASGAVDFLIGQMEPRVFYDLGASLGYYSFLAAARPDRPMRVHAFDLRPADLALIRAMAAETGVSGIETHLAGMGREFRGERPVWISRTRMFEREPTPAEYRDRWPARLKQALLGRRRRDLPERHVLTVDSIDAFAGRTPPPPDIIKIDIDGYEAEAVPGGMATFAAHAPAIMLELHTPRFYAPFATTRAEIAAPLFALGYSALFLTNHHRSDLCRVEPVGPGHPLLSRPETDCVIFV